MKTAIMAMKFTTCYPSLQTGGKTPCGLFAERQTGMVQELVCPEISQAQCQLIVARWNANLAPEWNGRRIEEEMAQFITDELKEQQEPHPEAKQ